METVVMYNSQCDFNDSRRGIGVSIRKRYVLYAIVSRHLSLVVFILGG